MISGISSVGSSFVTIAWQSTLFLLAGLVISFILRKHSARAHRILLLSIIASMLVPAMTIMVKHLGLGILEARTDTVKVVEENITEIPLHENNFNQFVFIPTELTFQPQLANTETPLLLSMEPEEEIVESQTHFNSFVRDNWRLILSLNWIAISFILTTRLLVTFLLGVRLLNKAEPLDCERISNALQHAKEKLAIKKDIKLYGSKIIKSPVIWCWRSKPALLVPKNAGRHHERIDWTGVLCHELAHWKRRDHISGLIAEITACILPWQILLWFAKSRLINLSEHACDDWVIATGKTGTDYAESLLDMIPGGQMAFVPAVVRDKNGLAQRVHRILQNSCGNPKTGLLWAITVCIITCSIAVTIAFAQTRPAQPESVIDANDVIALSTNQSLSDIKDKDQVVTKVFIVENNSSGFLLQTILPLLNSTSSITGEENTLTIFVTDKVSVLLQIEKIINDLDKPSQQNVSQQIFVVAHKDAVKLVEYLKNFLAQDMDTGSPTINHYESTPVTLIPWPEKNWIIARAPVGVLKLIGEILTKIDSESPSNLSYQEIVENTNISKNALFYFEHNFPSNIEQIIEPLLSDEGYLSTLVKEDNTGTVTIIDKPEVIHQIDSVLSNFEKVTEPEIGQWIFKISNKEPYEIIQSLRLVLKNKTNKDDITLVPDPNTKSLLVRASTENMMFVKSWIFKLDQEDSYLPESWNLYYDNGVQPDGSQMWPANMAKNLASLEIFPRPIDVKDRSWKDERFDFRVYSLDGTNMDDIIVRSEEDLRNASRSIFQPGIYLLKYERGYGTPETNYRMSCESFILDMSKPGMYKLYFAPKLGYGEVSGNAGGCYAVNFENIDSTFPMSGFAYINRQKDYLLDGLPNGRYRISAVDQQSNGNVVVSQAWVTIIDEEKIKLDIATPPKGDCTLTGSIFGKQNTYTVGSPQNPIQRKGEWFVLLRNHGSGEVTTTYAYEAQTMDAKYVIRGKENIVHETSEKANFKIEGIAPGEYNVTVIESPDYQGIPITRQLSKLLIISQGKNAVMNFDFRENQAQEVPSEPLIAIVSSSLGINDIKKSLTEWTGKEVIASEEARNLMIAIYAAEKITKSNAINLIYLAINHQGFLVEETEDTIYIKPTDKKSGNKPVSPAEEDSEIIGPAENEFIIDNTPNQTPELATIRRVESSTLDVNEIRELIKNAEPNGYEIVQINYHFASELVTKIKEILKESLNEYEKYIAIYSIPQSNHILIYGKQQYLDLVKKIITEIDIQDKKVDRYETIQINYHDINDLAIRAGKILQESDIDFQRNISIVPLSKSKQLIIYGKQEYRDIVKNIISEIDIPDIKLIKKVFDLKYADSESLKKKIDEVFGNNITSEESNQNTLPKETIMTFALPSRNQIIILTSEEKMKEIEKQISEWDSPIELSPMLPKVNTITLTPISPRVYTLNHVNNKEIADFLSSIFKSNDSGDKINNNSFREKPVFKAFKDTISFIFIPGTNKIIVNGQYVEGYLLVEAIINELDTAEFVPFDEEKAYKKILDNINNIEESSKARKILHH